VLAYSARMRSRGALLRAGALMAVAALALHQLRYAIGYGLDSPEASAGHGYLSLLGALAVGLLALAALQLLALATRPARHPGRGGPSFRAAWAAAAAALLAIFVAQELLEGVLAGGQGAAGLLAHAGWSAVPLAIALGAVVALALRGAERVLAGAGERIPALRRPAIRALRPWLRLIPPRASLLSRHLASRAPPLIS
jgi:hypothetical protein